MKFQDAIENEMKSWGDDIITALLVAIALGVLIIGLRGNLPLKVATLAYLALP